MKLSEIAEYVANNYPDFCTSQSCKVIKGCREEWYEENLIEPLLNFYIHEKMDLCECGRPEDTYEVSVAEKMYDLCYDMMDIEEQEEYEKYRCDKADILGWLCEQRGIKL